MLNVIRKAIVIRQGKENRLADILLRWPGDFGGCSVFVLWFCVWLQGEEWFVCLVWFVGFWGFFLREEKDSITYLQGKFSLGSVFNKEMWDQTSWRWWDIYFGYLWKPHWFLTVSLQAVLDLDFNTLRKLLIIKEGFLASYVSWLYSVILIPLEISQSRFETF